MLKHEFIAVTDMPDKINYNDYLKEDMIVISDDFIQRYYEVTRKILFYDNNLANKEYGLNYHGITIIDSIMVEKLKREITASCDNCGDLTNLINILDVSVSAHKYIIHFGV